MTGERRVVIAGATGFVGSALAPLLSGRGYAVTGISRSGGGNLPGVMAWQTPEAMDFSGHSAVVNLAGEPVNQRWTDERKKRFWKSRVEYTGSIVAAIKRLPVGDRPEVLVNASAVGFYGNRGDEFLVETAGPGKGYLAELCAAWEEAAVKAEDLGVRVVRLRIGIVLGRDGGPFAQLRRVFRLGIAGRLGNGAQWMPWIHVEDLCEGIAHALESKELRGAVNGTAPMPVRNVEFTRKLASALRRPAVLPVPGWALKLVFGEFAQALLDSGRAVPSALVEDGFQFRFETLEDALRDLTA